MKTRTVFYSSKLAADQAAARVRSAGGLAIVETVYAVQIDAEDAAKAERLISQLKTPQPK